MPYDFQGKGMDSEKEIINKRQYNKKVFDLGNGRKKWLCHTAHIHYKDPVDNQFKEIDTRLSFDNVNKVHKHNKASYHCEIPEYADGLIDLRTRFEGANFNVKFQAAQANHVLGVYTEDSNGDYVNYADCFGTGMDLRIYSYWKGIKKVIIAHHQPTIQEIQKMLFYILPQNNEDILVENEVWDKNSTVNVRGKRIKIRDSNADYIFLNPPTIHDSGNFILVLDMELSKSGSNLRAVHKIGADIPISSLVYPVYLEW